MKIIRRIATGTAIASKVANGHQLIEIVTTMIILLSLIIECLELWLKTQEAKENAETHYTQKYTSEN